MRDSDGLLAGVRVLDLSGITAGGRTTQTLGDLGADVIKVESATRPDPFRHWTMVTGSSGPDDLSSPPFRTVGRNKRSLAIDLKRGGSREVFRRLVASCDIVIENFRRGVMQRLGLDYETLRDWNGRVVLMSISSQGESGPDSGFSSYGVTLEALGGLMSVTGYDADTPTWSTTKLNYPDQLVAIMAPGLAISAVAAARESGRGCWIDLSQRELVTAMLGEFFLEPPAGPRGNEVDFGTDLVVACRGEDQWIAITLRSDSERAVLNDIVGADGPTTRTSVERWTRVHDKLEAMAVLQARGIAAAAVLRSYEIPGALDDPGSDFYVEVPIDGHGVERQLSWPVEFDSATAAMVRRPPPHLGQHTREILTEVGFGPVEIEQLIERGVAFDLAPQSAGAGS